jgi:tetratricopeptide (TPR) repeat protein
MKILTEVQVQLTEGEQARIVVKGTKSLEAFLKVLEGLNYYYKQTSENNNLARKKFEAAIAIDPNYSMAYSRLGETYIMDLWVGTGKSSKDSIEKAIEQFQKAIKLDESNAEAHGDLCYVYVLTRKHDEAIIEGKKAIDIGPNSADTYSSYAMALRYLGRPEDSVAMYQKALRLNPLPPSYYYVHLGFAYFQLSRYDEAINAYEKAIVVSPNNIFAYIGLAIAYSSIEHMDKARTVAQEVLRINPKFSVDRYTSKLPYNLKTAVVFF